MSLTGPLRTGLGAALLACPSLAPRLTGTPDSRGVRRVVRVLGARYVAQGACDIGLPHDPRLDAAIELLHAASMLPLAALDRRHARPALLSAGVAASLAAFDLVAHRADVLTLVTMSA